MKESFLSWSEWELQESRSVDIGNHYDLEWSMELQESTETLDERARPPRIKPKQREANAVKPKIIKKLLGPEGTLRPQVDKLMNLIKKALKVEARKKGVPVSRINMDTIKLKSF